MSAQAQDQPIDHGQGQLTNQAVHVAQTQQDIQARIGSFEPSGVNQWDQHLNQVRYRQDDNQDSSLPRNHAQTDLAAYRDEVEAEQAAGMTRPTIMVSLNTRQTRASSDGSNAPTTPFEAATDGFNLGATDPSMYDQGSPVAQPQPQPQPQAPAQAQAQPQPQPQPRAQAQSQGEPHPLKRSLGCRNIPLLRRVMEDPNISDEDKDFAKEHLKNCSDLPDDFYVRTGFDDGDGERMDELAANVGMPYVRWSYYLLA